jgi:LysR family transcriptional regulator, hypochlorite-specific transcription factor HypT
MGPANRPLDLDWLEDFLALAETGNFSKAAAMRAIAQPALSRHIRSLEEWVGADLVDRSGHPVALTAAGRKFQPLAQEALSSLEAARIKARAAQDLASASLRIASTHSLSILFFPQWLGTLDAQLQLGPIQTLTDNSRACEELMAQRRVQFLLCYGHPEVAGKLDEGRYPMIRLDTDVLLPVSAPDAAGHALYPLDGPGTLPVLDYSEASGLGRVMRCKLQSLRPSSDKTPSPHTVVFTAHNALLLKSMALAGRGLAWLPESLVHEEVADGRLRLAGSEKWQIPIDIRLYRQSSDMTPAAESLWNMVSARSLEAPAP